MAEVIVAHESYFLSIVNLGETRTADVDDCELAENDGWRNRYLTKHRT